MSDSIIEKMTVGMGENKELLVSFQYTLPSNLESFSISILDISSVIETDGFNKVSQDEDSKTYIFDWDRNKNSSTVTVSLENINRGHNSKSEEWSLATNPRNGSSYSYIGSDPGIRTKPILEESGVISSEGEIIFIGEYREWSEVVKGQKIRLAIPSAADPAHPPEYILDSLKLASESLNVGSRDESVLALTAPTDKVNWEVGGKQFGSSGFWALDYTDVDSPDNTWIHEYVHTRQDFETKESGEWLTEAIADYYEAFLPYDQGLIEFDDFYTKVETSKDKVAVLADPERWVSPYSDYYKGRRVLAALDAKIRIQTEGEKTFQDIFRRLNKVKDPITNDLFKDLIKRETGINLDDWVDKFISNKEHPKIPYDEGLFSSQPAVYLQDNNVNTEDKLCNSCTEESEKKYCPVCGAEVSESDNICPRCGIRLDRECPVCNETVITEEYCPSCGTKLIQNCQVCGNRIDRAISDPKYCGNCGSKLEW